MPDATELMQAIGGDEERLLVSAHADPKDQWQAQRDDLESWVKLILVHRGRWAGPVELAKNFARSSLDETRDLAKAKRKVSELAQGNTTALGDALLEISRALLEWRAGDLSAEAAMQTAAGAYVEFLFRARRDLGHFARVHLDGDLHGLFGSGSAELDLVDKGVMQLLSGPFDSGTRPLMTQQAQWTGRSEPPRARRWFNAWWGVLETQSPGNGVERWLPSSVAIGKAAVDTLPRGEAELRLCAIAIPFQRFDERAGRHWVDADASCARGEAAQLVEWLTGGVASFRPYSGSSAAEVCTKWGLLFVASGPTTDSVAAVRAVWGETMAPAIEARIRTPDQRGKRDQPPPDFQVRRVAEDFLAPYRQTRERLALMAGLRWDAKRGLGY